MALTLAPYRLNKNEMQSGESLVPRMVRRVMSAIIDIQSTKVLAMVMRRWQLSTMLAARWAGQVARRPVTTTTTHLNRDGIKVRWGRVDKEQVDNLYSGTYQQHGKASAG